MKTRQPLILLTLNDTKLLNDSIFGNFSGAKTKVHNIADILTKGDEPCCFLCKNFFGRLACNVTNKKCALLLKLKLFSHILCKTYCETLLIKDKLYNQNRVFTKKSYKINKKFNPSFLRQRVFHLFLSSLSQLMPYNAHFTGFFRLKIFL